MNFNERRASYSVRPSVVFRSLISLFVLKYFFEFFRQGHNYWTNLLREKQIHTLTLKSRRKHQQSKLLLKWEKWREKLFSPFLQHVADNKLGWISIPHYNGLQSTFGANFTDSKDIKQAKLEFVRNDIFRTCWDYWFTVQLSRSF